MRYKCITLLNRVKAFLHHQVHTLAWSVNFVKCYDYTPRILWPV